jgi:zinc protease
MRPPPPIAALLLAVLPAAAAAQAPSRGSAVRIAYEEETLPNGLKVIYYVDHATPVAAVDLWYDVGSKHEQPGKTGFAHLFEHVMFKGSRNVGDGKHWSMMEAAGGRAGNDVNGTTSFDRTNYFEQVPSNMLDLALWLEADRMGTLVETLTPEKLDNQREVVKNERRSSVDNQPYGVWSEKMLALLFPEGHPYHHSVLGSMEDLGAASVDDVKQFFRTYYAPNNAVLVVAGDIDVPQARALVRRRFGWIPRGPAAPPLRDATLPARLGASPREVVQDPNAAAPRVYVGYRMPGARGAQGPTVQLLADVLSSISSPMYDALVRRRQVATGVGAGSFGLLDGGDVLYVVATGKPGSDADSLERAVLAELDRADQALTQAALDRARAQLRMGIVDGLQRTGGFGGVADLLAQGWTYYRDPDWVNKILPKSAAVTLAGVRALAAERLRPDNRAVLVFVPRRATATAQGSR